MTATNYTPEPVNTDDVKLTPELLELTEQLAKNTHDNWAKMRMDEGWQWGEERNDKKKLHPSLIPYEELSDSEKEYDRKTAMEAIKYIVATGCTVTCSDNHKEDQPKDDNDGSQNADSTT